MEDNYKIKIETEGFEKAQKQIECLVDAYDGFPAQVMVKNCHDCTINIYPSQTKFTEVHGQTTEPVDNEEDKEKTKWLKLREPYLRQRE